MSPSGMTRLVLAIGAACVVAWGSYFLTLFTVDYLLGAQQLSHQLLMGSWGQVLRQIITIIRDSAWIVVPVIALYAAIVIAITSRRIFAHSMLAIAAGASLLLAILLWLRLTPLQTVPFITSFIVAMIFVHIVSHRRLS